MKPNVWSAMCVVTALAVTSGIPARADTAVPLVTCREVEAEWRAYEAGTGALPSTAKCWDFEAGTRGDSYFGAWSATGTAFNSQPTFGDNVRVDRVRFSNVQNGAARYDDLRNGVGGDYWNVPYPTGHQGKWWLGTYESRPSRSATWGAVQGEGVTGTLVSPTFTAERSMVHFLIGGGCDLDTESVAVEVRETVINPVTGKKESVWVQAVDAYTDTPLKATGACSELLRRQVFYTDEWSGLQGRTLRIVVRDGSTASWGHINADHFLHTDTYPNDWNGANQPVWGFADTHAHPVNFEAFSSWGQNGSDQHRLLWGTPGAGLATANPATELASCPSDHPSSTMGGKGIVATLEGGSFGKRLDDWVGPYHDQRGWPGYEGWPYWFTVAHQPMHVTWLHRAWQGGQRLLVATVGNNELIGWAMANGNGGLTSYLSDFMAIQHGVEAIKQFALANDTWLEVALTPADARRIIRAGKMAVVIGVEVDDFGDHCNLDPRTASGDVRADAVTSYTESPAAVRRARAPASTCTTQAAWTDRVQQLFALGVRQVIPIHLTDHSQLGGMAVKDDLFNVSNLFQNGTPSSITAGLATVEPAPAPSGIDWKFSARQGEPVWCWYAPFAGCSAVAANGYAGDIGPVLASSFAFDINTPGFWHHDVPALYPQTGAGHRNTVGVLANGRHVIGELKRRGMLIDLEHASERAKNELLGFDAVPSPLADPSCTNLADVRCQRLAAPVLVSHSIARALKWRASESSRRDKLTTEADLTDAQLRRVADLGGMMGAGLGTGDVRAGTAGQAAPTGSFWSTFGVANTCAGSSRSWAQSYFYTLKATRDVDGDPIGVALGTDYNGLQVMPNPRYGPHACHARGGRTYVVFPSGWWGHHFNRDATAVALLGEPGAAGWQTRQQYSSPRLNNGLSFPAGNMGRSWFNTSDPADDPFAEVETTGTVPPTSTHVALTVSRTGTRSFDLNVDGVAHYGLLPDFLEDLHTVGLTNEQLGPVFRSAEQYIRTWEKACARSDSTVSGAGCR